MAPPSTIASNVLPAALALPFVATAAGQGDANHTMYRWRDAQGRQVHAGMNSRQWVAGNYYTLKDGIWRAET